MGRRRRRSAAGPDGILLVDKPAGPTSAAVVDWIRWVFGGAKVGHCGTLDPAATGLLVVALGRGTRWVEYLTGADKTYRAGFTLGRSTTTADAEGETVATAQVDGAVVEAAGDVVRGWVGEHHLPPPAFSAVKIDGERAHAKARAGEDVELAPRPMTVHAVADVIAEVETCSVEATLRVSKGTYIRSLAVALGEAVDRPAHMSTLRRLGSGALSLDDSRVVDGITVERLEDAPNGKPRHRLRTSAGEGTRDGQRVVLEAKLIDVIEASPFPVARATGADAENVRRLAVGQRVEVEQLGHLAPPDGVGHWTVAGHDGTPVLLVASDGHTAKAERTIVPAV